jgi:energy-coupling factor transporter ATP-binding protein EcfA2
VYARKRIGLIFQDSDSQIVGQTVAEGVAFGPENLKLTREDVDHHVKNHLMPMNSLSLHLTDLTNSQEGKNDDLLLLGYSR